MNVVWVALLTICLMEMAIQVISLMRGGSWGWRMLILVLSVIGAYYAVRGLHAIGG